ncbi:TetR/AcrR family transcriptional regulator [Xanthomonas albilineans]|uniref:Putative transcriptional regulator transcription regulator protein n=1 Tax=Xanthomonas albilineans (strain GPE PC73 / CFBP 7063) TaxID=380358 RepID=D2UDW1_XANAP|nr:TetR/AcrR family transcriptional regulator [Xanthomonas albilineans]PPU94628.1 TetR family transcriptional regulator [Xanthomonas albilineans]QHQ28453.1 putative transcriptional regulator transcription regulator protein [Xanthomonas albilineans]CBA16218.1 putative transcriptional regulator transcription regulator protein [Xanthomonas albilineans GPE PC73]
MARDTRRRILDTALAMFNAQGEPHVTTNHIADELEISPGNLYYHFRNKDDIIEHLFTRYEERMDAAMTLPGTRLPGLEDFWLQLHLVFECIWDYRFLYRDLIEIISRSRRLRLRFARILHRADDSTQAVLQGLAQAGAMHATTQERRCIATNVLVVATFWLNYAAARGEKNEQLAIRHGIAQVMRLISPFLREAERAHLTAMTHAYLVD